MGQSALSAAAFFSKLNHLVSVRDELGSLLAAQAAPQYWLKMRGAPVVGMVTSSPQNPHCWRPR